MSKYHDDRTAASDSIPIIISEEKLRRFHPQLFGWQSWLRIVRSGPGPTLARHALGRITEHVRCGDSRAALVMLTRPLIVAPYTDEQDAVVLLQFPEHLVDEYGLTPGSRLLTVNTYEYGFGVVGDIVAGPANTRRYANFYPIIVDFVCDGRELLQWRKKAISQAEWQRTQQLAAASLARPKVRIRDGRPLWSSRPGKRIEINSLKSRATT